jgi:hypothetical protein
LDPDRCWESRGVSEDYTNQVVNKFEQGILPDVRIWRR